MGFDNFWFEALVVVKVFKPDMLEGMDEDTDLKIAFNPAITQHNFCLLYLQQQMSRTPCSQLSASPSLSGLFPFNLASPTISSILRTHGGASHILLDGCTCARLIGVDAQED